MQLEYTARLDFLWRVQAKEEINEMKELREHNENMLRNILPSHVARHFLEKDRDNEVRPTGDSFLGLLSFSPTGSQWFGTAACSQRRITCSVPLVTSSDPSFV